MKLVLIQIRQPGEPMTEHEKRCISKRLGDRNVDVVTRNVFSEEARADWLDGADCLVIGGSGNYSVNDARSDSFTKPVQKIMSLALDRGLPGFGICFGHQLLGDMLGHQVLTEPKYAELGTSSYQLTDAGLKDPLFSVLDETFTAVTGHTDHVSGTPKQVELLACNNTLSTQAFKVRGTPFYSTQFHPDLTAQEARLRYLAVYGGFTKVNPGATEDAVSLYQDGKDTAQTLIGRFVDIVLNNDI